MNMLMSPSPGSRDMVCNSLKVLLVVTDHDDVMLLLIGTDRTMFTRLS